MRIGGFIKQSFIDWDGMLAAVVFTKGCNMRCGYCHNPSLVVPSLMSRDEDIPERTVLEYLAGRGGWLDGVVVTGGEPTIHPDLPDFIAAIKSAGYGVKLDTNGTNPVMLEALVAEGLLDFVAMDVKHIPCCEDYRLITTLSAETMDNINRSIRFLQQGNIPYQFRTTIVPELHTPEVCDTLVKRLAGSSYVTHRFRRSGKDGIVEDYIV